MMGALFTWGPLVIGFGVALLAYVMTRAGDWWFALVPPVLGSLAILLFLLLEVTLGMPAALYLATAFSLLAGGLLGIVLGFATPLAAALRRRVR